MASGSNHIKGGFLFFLIFIYTIICYFIVPTWIDTIIYYPIPIHLQPAYSQIFNTFNRLPITEKLCGEVLSLPIFPEISLEQQDYVVEVIREISLEASISY